MEQAIYIVFSSTPTGMGRLIRVMTRNPYNHVSLSLSEDIKTLYSFARHYRRIPLYGGFVEESILRYRSLSRDATVKICRIPMEERQFTYLKNYIDWLWNDRANYIYNTPGAMFSLLHQRAAIPKAHTCASFINKVLSRYHLAGVTERDAPTIRALERKLAPYVVYEGSAAPLAAYGEWGKDEFPLETSRRYAIYKTAYHFGRLAKRVLLEVL